MTMDMVYWKIMTSTITCTLEYRSGREEVIEFSASSGSIRGTNRFSRVLVVKKSIEFAYWLHIWTHCTRLMFFFFFFKRRTGSNPKIRRNKIWGGQNGGILVYNSGKFFIYFLSVLYICLFTDLGCHIGLASCKIGFCLLCLFNIICWSIRRAGFYRGQ